MRCTAPGSDTHLHAVVTDIPLGAWTTAAVCDVIEEMSGETQYAPAADLAVAVGLGGAALSALSGLADWSETSSRARKVGLVHGLLNLAGVALYTGSLVCRKRGDRLLGRRLGLLGYMVAAGSAWLGGELVYWRRWASTTRRKRPIYPRTSFRY